MLGFAKSRMVLALAVVFCAATFVGCPSQKVVVIDNFNDITLESVWEDVVNFFTGADTPFEVGDIIAGTGDGGFLRHVEAIDEDGGHVTTETTQASLAEAIEDGTLSGAVQFTPEDFQKANVPLAKAGGVTINLSGIVLYNKDGIKVSIASGSIAYAPKISLDAQFSDHKLVGFNAVSEGQLNTSLRLRVEATAAATLSKEWDIIPPVTKPFVFYIGPVPVVGTASFRLPVGLTGTISAGASAEAGFDSSTYVKIGANLNGGNWTNMSDFGAFKPVAQPAVLSFASGGGLDVYLKPTAGLNLYGVSDLTGFAQPYVSADAVFVPSPFTFILTAGLNGGINYKLGIFDFNLVDKSWYFPGPQWELYRYTYPYTIPTTFTFTLP